jgi:hypothetical protein
MTTIYDRIKSDITNALKAKDLTKANTLRYVKGILDNNATSAKPVLPSGPQRNRSIPNFSAATIIDPATLECLISPQIASFRPLSVLNS